MCVLGQGQACVFWVKVRRGCFGSRSGCVVGQGQAFMCSVLGEDQVCVVGQGQSTEGL